MLKSSIGITVSNFIMIWIVALNSYGPGWEVPVETMLLITRLSFLLLLCLIFSAVTFIINLKQAAYLLYITHDMTTYIIRKRFHE